jgi:hypothetical protein
LPEITAQSSPAFSAILAQRGLHRLADDLDAEALVVVLALPCPVQPQASNSAANLIPQRITCPFISTAACERAR